MTVATTKNSNRAKIRVERKTPTTMMKTLRMTRSTTEKQRLVELQRRMEEAERLRRVRYVLYEYRGGDDDDDDKDHDDEDEDDDDGNQRTAMFTRARASPTKRRRIMHDATASSSTTASPAHTSPSSASPRRSDRLKSAPPSIKDNDEPDCDHSDGTDTDTDSEDESDESDESEDPDKLVMIRREFEGGLDADGEPHDRGTLIVTLRPRKFVPDPLSNSLADNDHATRSLTLEPCAADVQDVFTGRFVHGKINGRGLWRYHDDSSLSATWRDDVLCGQSVFTYDDGYSVEGAYVDDVLCGRVREYSHGELRFDGWYENNKRNGHGRYLPGDGGVYDGEWLDGEFHGDDNVYHYPPGTPSPCSLRGQWRHGQLVAARFYCNGILVESDKTTIYAHDESIGPVIAAQPLLRDPYESMCCTVRASTEGEDSGEGLFAKIDLPANTVVSFYNGTKQNERLTERRPWTMNSNTIALSEENGVDIDVAEEYATLDKYCASLGHKANHSFEPNRRTAKYDHFYHPRFGHIKCIRTLCAVRVGQELLVDYGYTMHPSAGPSWWRKWYRERRERRNEREQL